MDATRGASVHLSELQILQVERAEGSESDGLTMSDGIYLASSSRVSSRISPRISASEIRNFAQCALAASVQLHVRRLSLDAERLYEAWTQATSHVAHLLGETPLSHTAIITKRAIGMLLRSGEAATDTSHALARELRDNDRLKQLLADGRWDEAAFDIATTVITDYHAALERGQ